MNALTYTTNIPYNCRKTCTLTHTHRMVIASKHVVHADNTLKQKSLSYLLRGPFKGVYNLPPTLSWKALISINILLWGESEGVCGRQLLRQVGRWIIRSSTAMSNWMLIRANQDTHIHAHVHTYTSIYRHRKCFWAAVSAKRLFAYTRYLHHVCQYSLIVHFQRH